MTTSIRNTLSIALLASCLGDRAASQELPPSPIRYTAAVAHSLRETVRLTGTVEAVTESVVASELQGLVTAIHVAVGDRVAKGEALADLRRHNLELQLRSLAGRRREAEARRSQAERQRGRARELHEGEVITQAQLDDAHSELEAWLGRLDELDAEVAYVRDQLARTTIRAPFDGVVARRHLDLGEWVAAGGAVIDLVALDPIEVDLAIPERYFAGLSAGHGARVHFAADPDLDREGIVRAVIPRADPQARTFPVRVRVANDGRIAVGMVAEVELELGAGRPGVIVPKDAIVARGPERLVYILGTEGDVTPTPVVPGIAAGQWIEVVGDVAAGAHVVTRGNERLFPGMKVSGEALEYELP